jgi:dephospho-CoA kinase
MIKHFQVGVTGGIGSGKTVVTKIFTVMGIPVYDSDSRAKQLMSEDPELKSEIIRAFGDESYGVHGLDRKFIAAKVFNNPAELERLNQMVHPKVGRDYSKWLTEQTSNIVINEAALLYEKDIAKRLNFLIVVTAPDIIRIERVLKRDNRTESQIREIISNQWPQEKSSLLADAVIVNDNTTALIPQVLDIYETIKRKASLQNKLA